MGDLDFGDCGEVWIPKPIFRVENTDFTSESELVWNSSTILDGSYYRHIGDTYSPYRDLYTPDGIVDKFEWWIKENGYKKEEIPEMKVEENREFGTSNYKYAVACHNYEDLLEKNILKCISIMKAKLILKSSFGDGETVEYCHKNGIVAEAWSPLTRGEALKDPLIIGMAEKYGKSAAQIILRFDVQCKVAAVPKSTHKERVKENIDVFGFSISDEDVAAIKKLDTGIRRYRDPDNHGF